MRGAAPPSVAAAAAILALECMSAMLTYFGFMLQKVVCERNDRS
jgi:hypothetical protein